ncbi:MAG TPA: TonB-dependent receptor [Steroidobacteraceae bacterium]|nr:TonB-dependent receptor [Steroidobacteraceae bacterium]
MRRKPAAHTVRGEVTFLAAAICAVLRTAPAAAATASSDTSLSEIIVTAERRSESIQDVPLSVTAITGETLDKFNDHEFGDYAHTIPNLSYGTGSDFGVTNGRTVTIRGITGGRFRNGQATTSFYLNDTPVPQSLDPRVLDLQRIEVLRGPQGTLFGSSAMGGTIRVITKPAEAKNVYGSFDVQGFDINHGGAGYDISGTFNTPLIQDQLAFKISAYSSYRPGYFTREFGIATTPGYTVPASQAPGKVTHVADDIEEGGMATLTFTPAAIPGLTVTPMVIYQSSRGNGFPLADFSTDNLVQVRPLDVEESWKDQWTFSSLTAKYNAGFGSFIGSTAWFHREGLDDEDNTEASATYWGPTYATGQLPPVYLASPAPSFLTLGTVTQELRFESAFPGPLQTVIGVYYEHGKSHTGQDITQPLVLGQFGYIQDVPLSNNEVAEFGDLTYTPISAVELSAGVRASSLEFKKRNYFYGWINGGLTDVPVSHSENAVTPRYTAKYKFNPDAMVYVSAAKGFRSGGANAVPSQCGPGSGSFKSDSLWSYEIGSKDTLFDNRMNLRVAAYRIDWTNIQQNILLPCTYSVTQNAGTATSTGAEVEADMAPIRGLNMTFSAGYDDAKITSVPAGATGFVTGQALNGVPKVTASLLADYSIPTDFGAVFIRPQYSFTGRSVSYSVVSVQSGGRPRASYSLVDLNAGVAVGSWEASIFAKNLLDVRANLGDEQSEVIELQSPTVRPRYLIAQPRTLGVELKYRFSGQ